MARKPSEKNRQGIQVERTFDERAFVDGVFNGEYILVVGSGVILDRSQFPESRGDISRYIIDEINSDRNASFRDFTDIARATPLGEKDPIHSLLADGIEYELSDMCPELVELLRTKLFRFVLTTTIDNYLETLLCEIWKNSGEELRIVNIADSQSLKDFQDALKHSRSNKYTQPTLFYTFGKAVKGRPKPRGFVETDVDAIKIIEKWLTDVDREYIVPFLNAKRMLALGCKFDDWYFRFFWYIITRGFDDSDRGGAKDFDGSMLTTDSLAAMFTPGDSSLKEYLARRGVCLHEDVWQFMSRIHELLTSTAPDSPFREMVLARRRQGEIFVSYKSCDVLDASSLFCRLTRNRLNVWFDNIRLYVGDNYDCEIKHAIGKAKIFIPVLSPAIGKELEEKGLAIGTYYSDEWRWAASQPQLRIMPVAIGGFSPRSSAYAIFEQIIGRPTTAIDMTQLPVNPDSTEKAGYAKLLDSIETHLQQTHL